MAFSVYPDRLDVVFDISRGETSLCYDILAICEFSGDKSREVVVDGDECTEGAGVAYMLDRVRDDPHRHRHYSRDHLWESARWMQRA
jgi:hypothetical protein